MNNLSIILLSVIVLSYSCKTLDTDNAFEQVCIYTSEGNSFCKDAGAVISNESNKITLIADLNELSKGKSIQISWQFISDGQAYPIEYDSFHTKNNISTIQSNLIKPSNGWPRGDYQVMIYVQSEKELVYTKKFNIN